MGNFQLVDYHWADASDTEGNMRQVVVFRLRLLTGGTAVQVPIPHSPNAWAVPARSVTELVAAVDVVDGLAAELAELGPLAAD